MIGVKVKLLFADDRILYREDSKNSNKTLLEVISKFSNVAAYSQYSKISSIPIHK